MQIAASLLGLSLDAIEQQIGTAPTLRLFSSPHPTATTDSNPAGELCAITLPSDWMAPEANGGKSMIGPWLGLATGNGVAQSWRISNGATCYLQGTAGARNSTAEMRLKNADLRVDQIITVLQFTLGNKAANLAVFAAVESADTGAFVATLGSSGGGLTSSSRVNLAKTTVTSGASYNYADKTLGGGGRWNFSSIFASPLLGGDWVDADNVFRGTNYSISQTVSSQVVSFDISSIDGDLLLRGFSGVSSATIDGQAAVGWWVVPNTTAGQAFGQQPFPSNSGNNVFFMNPNRGTTLTVTRTGSSTQTININKVVGRVIDGVPMTDNGLPYNPDVWEHDFTTEAALRTALTTNPPKSTGAAIVEPIAFDYSFSSDPLQNNLKYIRYGAAWPATSGNSRLTSWFKYIDPNAGFNELWLQYSCYIETDSRTGIDLTHGNGNGVKMSGIGTSYFDPQTISWGWIGEQGVPSATYNVGLYEYRTYSYDHVNGQQINNETSCAVRDGRWYVFKQHFKFENPKGSGQNGLMEYYVNNNLVLQKTGMNFLTLQETGLFLDRVHFQHYHGGIIQTAGPLHYRMARLAISTHDIGLPPEFLNPQYPLWRDGMTLNTWQQVSGTAMAPTLPGTTGPAHWSGVAYTDNAFYSCAQGGHNGNQSDPGGGNKSFKIDLSTNAPAWVKVHDGTSNANTPAFSTMDSYDAARPNRIYYPPDTGAVALRPPTQGYYLQHYVKGAHAFDGKERIISVYLNAPRSGSGATNSRRQVDGFQTQALVWDSGAQTSTAFPFAGGVDGSAFAWGDVPLTGSELLLVQMVCHDPRDSKIYYACGTNLQRFNPSVSTNHWANPPAWTFPANFTWTHSGCLIDINRNRWVSFRKTSTNQTPRLEYFPIAGGAMQTINVNNYTGANTFQNGFTHDVDLDRYMALVSTTTQDELWSIHPDTGDSTLVAVKPLTTNGAMSFFAYFSQYKGVAAFSSVSQDMWFLPTQA